MKKTEIRTFGIIGGDKRQLYLAQALFDDCYEVLLGGFDKLISRADMPLYDIKETADGSDAVILPVPSIRSDGSVNTPFSERVTRLDEITDSLRGKPIFVSMRDRLLRTYPKLDAELVYDYSAREDFAILNALPTAEGAVECAMREYSGTVSGSRSLICGFGRIGKLLSRLLKALDSDVTVSTDSREHSAYLRALGFKSVKTSGLKSVRGFDLVFNTVPAVIFDRELLLNTDKDTIIIDLASLPGGVDFEAAHALGINAVRALSLPGKCAPRAAGEIIKAAVLGIIEEVNR